MLQIARVFWNIPLIASNASAVVAWINGAGSELLQEFLPAIYTFVIVFCTGGMVAINWPWINRRRPSVRFAALTDDLKAALRTFGPMSQDAFLLDPMVKYERERLSEKLAALGIAMPDVDDSRAWADLLPKVLLDAQFGRIDKARKRGTS